MSYIPSIVSGIHTAYRAHRALRPYYPLIRSGIGAMRKRVHLAKGGARKRVKFGSRSVGTQTGASGNSSISSRKGWNAPAVSQYHEAQLLYNRRPAPRRVKARARRFDRRAETVISRNWPNSVSQINYHWTVSSLAQAQQWTWVPLLSSITVGQPHIYNQINDLCVAVEANSFSGTSSPLLDLKFIIKNAVLNLDIHNPVTISDPEGYPASVRVYHLWARNDSIDDPATLFPVGIQTKAPGTVPSGSVQMAATNLQVTPFDSSLLCQRFIVKSCRNFVIQAGQTISLQLRDRREYRLSETEIQEALAPNTATKSCLRKYTEGYLVVFNGFIGDIGLVHPETLAFNATVNIRYSAPQMQRSAALYYVN